MAKAKSEKKDEALGDFFKDAIKSLENEDASIVANGILGDVSGWIDTGSYAFNALLSGTLYGGAAGNKVTQIAGPPSTGKTFFCLNIVSEFLKANPKGYCFYFEPEVAVHTGMISSRGIDTKRIATVLTPTVEEFRTQAVRILNKLIERPEKERPPVIMVLDSLGQLSTSKEVADVTSGEPTRDMTRAQLIRGAFRVMTPKLGKAKVPLIMSNHTYAQVMSYGAAQKAGGGDGGEYASSATIYLSKSKFKEGADKTAVTGVLLKCRLKKSRLTVENRSVEVLLRYDTGLDRYYGLLPLAVKFGVVSKVSVKYTFPDGTEARESEIDKTPEKYFTKAVLDAIDAKCADEFLYGNSNLTEDTDESA